MSARTTARDVDCPTCGITAPLPCRSTTTGLSNTDTHKARHQAAQTAVSGPRIVELCAGYGGLGMGVSAVLGGRMVWCSEYEADPSRILAHHWPDVPNLDDLTKIDWSAVPGCDVLTAGFPCQPFSHAGKRLGANDARHLWPYIRDGINVLRPQLVVLENVRGLASGQGEPDTDEILALDERIAHIRRALAVIERRRGKAIREQKPEHVRYHTDNGHRLMVELRSKLARASRARRRLARALATVLGDLADLGYDAQWYGLRAADVGAPHGRFRFFIFAWPADAPSDPAWVVYGDHAAATAPHARNAAHLTLLPTPAVNDMGDGKTLEWWDAWTAARQKAKHGNGNGHGKSLEIEAQRLLKTPQASDDARGRARRFLDEGPSRRFDLSDQVAGLDDSHRWGEYVEAVRAWEPLIGRLAPSPTEIVDGRPTLSPLFVEWMMGLPAGHVTDPAIWQGMSDSAARNAQLKALGNGVVWQQAAAATTALIEDMLAEHATRAASA